MASINVAQSPNAAVHALPGVGIRSTVPGDGWQSMDGTSMAAPHVAGAVAALLSVVPQATHAELLEALVATAADVDIAGPDNASGFGRIEVGRAAAYLREHHGG